MNDTFVCNIQVLCIYCIDSNCALTEIDLLFTIINFQTKISIHWQFLAHSIMFMWTILFTNMIDINPRTDKQLSVQ